MSKKPSLESKELELMGLRKNEEEYYIFISIKSDFKRMKKTKERRRKKRKMKGNGMLWFMTVVINDHNQCAKNQ